MTDQPSSRANDGTVLTYDLDPDELPSEGVLKAVAAASASEAPSWDAVDLADGLGYPPLYHAIDPDALDSLFRTGPTPGPPDGAVSFTYCEYDVTVFSRGSVVVAPEDR